MQRLVCVAVFALLWVQASVATAKISSKQKEELAGYVTKLAETTDAEAKHALLLVRGATADADDRKKLTALESDEDPQVRLGAKVAAVVGGDKKAHDRVAVEIIKQGADFGTLRHALAPLPDADELKIAQAILRDGKEEHHTGLFQYLGHSRDKLFDLLLEQLASSKHRGLAAKTLVAEGRADALPAVERLLKAKDEPARVEATQIAIAFTRRVETLADAKKLLVVATKDASGTIRELAARRLVELEDGAGARVLVDLAKAAPKPAEVASILGFLIERGVFPSAGDVAQWLESDDALVKQRAYQITAAAKDKKFVGKLIEMYGSTEFDDRLLAVQAIGYSKDARASKVLTSSLFEARQDIRAAAVDGLVVLARPDTLDALKRSLTGEKDKQIKLRVIDAIGAVKSDQALQLLRFQVTNSDVDVKTRTVEAIRTIGKPEGAKALDILLRDRNTDVQWRAFLAILDLDAKAGRAHFATMFRNPPPTLLSDLGEVDAATRKAVIEHLLTKGDGSAREAAVDLVKHDGSNDAALYELAMQSTTDLSLRKDLVQFFGERGARKDVAVLETLARGKDPTLARLAAWMLTRHPSSGLEASYRGMLASKDETLQAIAAYGLVTVWQ